MQKTPTYIRRPLYMERIRPHIGSSLIKILTGQRRVGKSYLLYQIADEILASDPHADIVSINIARDRFILPIGISRELYQHIVSSFTKDATTKVVMLDEVQELEGFEQCVAALFEQGGYDIYLTGSNSRLLSGDLASLLSGRYTTIEVFSLSYREFLLFHAERENEESLARYLRIGGLPYLGQLDKSSAEVLFSYFKTVEETILLNDIIPTHKGSNKEFFRYLIRFLADTIGSPVSANSVAKYLKNQHFPLSVPSVLSFLETLQKAYLVYKCEFSDISGKQLLDISHKYYFGDLGIRNYLCGGYTLEDRAKVLENAVYLSLLQKGYHVRTGRGFKDAEIDFVATKGDAKAYIQVCESFGTQEKIEREFGNLLLPKDAYPRYMVTSDVSLDGMIQDGVPIYSLRRWLLQTPLA